MKFLIVIYYIFSSFNLLFSQYSQNNFVNHYRFKGKVKYCVEHQYETIKKSGKLIKSTYFGKIAFKYDINGNLVEESNFGRSRDNNKWYYWLSHKILFDYDDKNLLVKKTYFHADGSQNETLFYYDDKNLLIKETSFGENQSQLPLESFYYKYDFNNDGKPIIKFTYNSVTPCGKYFNLLQYDEFGNLSKEIFLESNESDFPDTLAIESYKYFNQGKLAQYNITDFQFQTRKIKIYDKNGNEILSIEDRFDLKSTRITKLHYDFNKNGNWIKQYFSVSDQKNKTFLNQREYIYY
jgi:hypothetical protein